MPLYKEKLTDTALVRRAMDMPRRLAERFPKEMIDYGLLVSRLHCVRNTRDRMPGARGLAA